MLFISVLFCNCAKNEQDLHPSIAYSEQSHEVRLTQLMIRYVNFSSFNEKQKSMEAIASIISEIEDLSGRDIAIKTLESAINKHLAIHFNFELSSIEGNNFSESPDLPCYRYWKSEVLSAINDVFNCVDSPPNLLDSMSCFGAFLDRIVAANHVFTDCMKQYEID